MNKQELLEKYYKDEDKILIAHILDKIEFTKSKNKIASTDFLDMYQKKIAENVLNCSKEENYIFYGGFDEADKNMLILYPDKMDDVFRYNRFDYNKLINVIKITLPNELKGTYNHKDYLSGLMKLGIERKKCGDILVTDFGAYIITCNELTPYICNNLQQLTRFSKSKIEVIKLKDMIVPKAKTQEIRITTTSMRLDNIVPELANVSRTLGEELIEEQRVFINYENETRKSKIINEGDVIVIRGKGKFIIKKNEGISRKGKNVLIVEHYI